MARYMSSTELYQKMEEDTEIVVIDVASLERYQSEHIPGAINIPLNTLETEARKFRKNQRLVVYGSEHTDEASNQAATILESMGFRKVSDFDGGVHAWKQAGFLTEGPAN